MKSRDASASKKHPVSTSISQEYHTPNSFLSSNGEIIVIPEYGSTEAVLLIDARRQLIWCRLLLRRGGRKEGGMRSGGKQVGTSCCVSTSVSDLSQPSCWVTAGARIQWKLAPHWRQSKGCHTIPCTLDETGQSLWQTRARFSYENPSKQTGDKWWYSEDHRVSSYKENP